MTETRKQRVDHPSCPIRRINHGNVVGIELGSDGGVEPNRDRPSTAAGPSSPKSLGSEPVALGDSLWRVLATDVASVDAVPAFASSAMDGFALRHADVGNAGPQTPVRLSVVGESRAGHPCDRELSAGESIAISTGAMMPLGADAVVPVEQAHMYQDHVEILAAVDESNDVRHAGEDIRAGRRCSKSGRA